MIIPFDALKLAKLFQLSEILAPLITEAGLDTHQYYEYSFYDLYHAAVDIDHALHQEEWHDYEPSVKLYYSHPSLDDYFWLAREYGWRHGLSDKNNPYIIEERKYLRSLLFVDCWSANWRLYLNTHKPHGCGVLFNLYVGEMDIEEARMELAYDLYMLRRHYVEKANELRSLLAEEEDCAIQERKEAA